MSEVSGTNMWGGCVRSFGHEHDFCPAEKAENTDARTNYAVKYLRGPAAILFISCDTCSDGIAKLFRACFSGVSHNFLAIRCKMGYRTDVPV